MFEIEFQEKGYKMLAIQLKNYLNNVPDEANIMVFVGKTGKVRQLRMADIDSCHDGIIIIDAECDVPAKHTNINPNDVPKPC